MKSLLCLLALVSINAFSAEDKNQYLPLKDAREKIVFNSLSDDDKRTIITYAKTLFSKVYVNLEHKTKLYSINPLADLKIIEDRYQEMNESEFHERMLKVYSSVRDFHVNYNLPKPYACYRSILPFSFQKMGGNKIIISAINLELKNFLPELTQLAPGDELISYQGVSPAVFIKKREAIVGASTPDAAFVQGVFDLSYRSHYNTIVPTEDAVEIVLKKQTGEIISMTVPWIARYKSECIRPKAPEEKALTGKRINNLREIDLKERKMIFQNWKNKFLTFFKSKISLRKKTLTAGEQVSLEGLHSTRHPNLFWKVISYQGQEYGYLKLDSFDGPEGSNAAVAEVKKVLENGLKDTTALVIDLRGNYGGQINFAEQMAALFGAMPVKSLPFYVRANDFILPMFLADQPWLQLITPEVANNTLVGPSYLTSVSHLERVPQSYFGKVTLLTNSECFSSCDLFSAVMKDYARVKIYGTDRSTFGGGANVWATGYLKPAFDSAGLPALPQNMSMRVTARHALRLKDNSIIEDHGVASDVVLKEEMEDILTKNSTVVAKIYNDFLKESSGKKSSDTFLDFSKERLQTHGEKTMNFQATGGNIDYISVFKNKKFVQSFNKDDSGNINIVLPVQDSVYGSDTLEVYGFNRNSQSRLPVLRKPIIAESLPDFKNLEDTNIMNDIVFTNYPRNASCGWIKSGDSLTMAENYCPESIMEANLSVALPKKNLKLSFDIALETEPDFDFFEIVAIVDGEEFKILGPVSQPQNAAMSLNLDKFSGKKIDLKFRITSDEAFAGKGGSISNIKIE